MDRVLSKLPPHENIALHEQDIARTLRKVEYLCHQGDIWPYCVYLVSGELRWAMLSSEGKEHVLFNLDPGEVFWAHSLFDDLAMPAALIAAQNSEFQLWDRSRILPFLYKYPDAMWELTRLLTGIMRQAREIIYDLAFQPVAGRLARILHQRCLDQSGNLIERDFTLEEIASVVAAAPEAICRLLYQFQEDKILEISRASINIRDIDALEKISHDH